MFKSWQNNPAQQRAWPFFWKRIKHDYPIYALSVLAYALTFRWSFDRLIRYLSFEFIFHPAFHFENPMTTFYFAAGPEVLGLLIFPLTMWLLKKDTRLFFSAVGILFLVLCGTQYLLIQHEHQGYSFYYSMPYGHVFTVYAGVVLAYLEETRPQWLEKLRRLPLLVKLLIPIPIMMQIVDFPSTLLFIPLCFLTITWCRNLQMSNGVARAFRKAGQYALFTYVFHQFILYHLGNTINSLLVWLTSWWPSRELVSILFVILCIPLGIACAKIYEFILAAILDLLHSFKTSTK
jgi:ABC-type multidrug transport system permease subunit